jgi:hypothetical protein
LYCKVKHWRAAFVFTKKPWFLIFRLGNTELIDAMGTREEIAIFGLKPVRTRPYPVATLATGPDRIAMLTVFLAITGSGVVEASAPGYGYACNVAEARCRQE